MICFDCRSFFMILAQRIIVPESIFSFLLSTLSTMAAEDKNGFILEELQTITFLRHWCRVLTYLQEMESEMETG